MSFRFRLFLVLSGLTVLMVAVSIFVVGRHLRHHTTLRAKTEMLMTPRRFDTFKRGKMDNLIAQAIIISADHRLRGSIATGDTNTIKLALDEVYQNYPADIFGLINDRGAVAAAVGKLNIAGDDLTDAPVIRDAMNGYDSGDTWIRNGRLHQVAAVPVMSGDSQLGILAIGQEYDHWLSDEFNTLTGLQVAFIVNQQVVSTSLSSGSSDIGKVIMTMIMEGSWVTDVPSGIPLQDDGSVTELAPFFQFEIDKEPFAAVLFGIDDARNQSIAQCVIFRSMLPDLTILGRIQAALLAVGLAAIAVALIAAFLLAKGLTRPINRLVDSAKQLGKGDLYHVISPEASDEIGNLALALDRMRVSLKNAQEGLIRSEKLSAIGNMVSSIIHDFKQPMTVIFGYAELMAMKETDAEQRARYRDMINEQMDRMMGMINELLDFARGEARLHFTKTRLSYFLKGVLSGFENDSSSRNIKFETKFEWDGEVVIDEARLQRGLENIIRNAVQALQSRGVIRLESAVENGSVLVSVIDNGPGIPPDVIEHLFEPFFTHGKRQGTGLGLAVAQRVVEDHDGKITVQSTPGRCTTFTVWLPDKLVAAASG